MECREHEEKIGHHEVRIHIDRARHASPNPTTGRALYAMGNVPHGHALYREVEGDHEDALIFRDEENIHLREDEHFYNTPLELKITVNGRQKTVNKEDLSFTEIVALADNLPSGAGVVYTVTYRRGHGSKPEGTLVVGETVKIKEGMIFNVSATNKS